MTRMKAAAPKKPMPPAPAPVSPAQMRFALTRMIEWVACVGLANVKRSLEICAEEAATVSTSQELADALMFRAECIGEPVEAPNADHEPSADALDVAPGEAGDGGTGEALPPQADETPQSRFSGHVFHS